MRPPGRNRSEVWHPLHLRLDRARSGDGARRELALKALHLLVVGAAGPRSGADRLGPTVIAGEGGACGQIQRRLLPSRRSISRPPIVSPTPRVQSPPSGLSALESSNEFAILFVLHAEISCSQ